MDGCMFCDKHSEKCRTHSFEIGIMSCTVAKFEINYDPSGNGLYEIQRISRCGSTDYYRLRAYGSTRNMPNRYYNKLSNSSLYHLFAE